MFTANLETFKIREKELHRQANQYRIIRSLEANNSLTRSISEYLGKILMHTAQHLINRSRASAL